jgi:UDP-4-amino-4-deoxy-L-arabinose formyltransferase/UDP-glucuronic acid dehydrogenase (UDP-4-keto-hexauronic acid decarboxylating)
VRIALIGRSELLYRTGLVFLDAGHEVSLIVTAKEAPEYEKTADDFARLDADLGAEFIRSATIRSETGRIKDMPAIDIGLSVNYPNIIPAQTIECFRLGILNAHAGDLPRFRGNATLAWAILAGETRAGLCIHRMVGGELDAGDIIAREYHPIDLQTKVGDLVEWVRERTPDLFLEAARRLEADPAYVLARQSQDPKDALRCFPRRPEDGRIAWTQSAADILRLINASNTPYAGAFCMLNGELLIIRSAFLEHRHGDFLAVPGQITEIREGTVCVATGDRKMIRITEVERDGSLYAPSQFITSIRTRLS